MRCRVRNKKKCFHPWLPSCCCWGGWELGGLCAHGPAASCTQGLVALGSGQEHGRRGRERCAAVALACCSGRAIQISSPTIPASANDVHPGASCRPCHRLRATCGPCCACWRCATCTRCCTGTSSRVRFAMGAWSPCVLCCPSHLPWFMLRDIKPGCAPAITLHLPAYPIVFFPGLLQLP